MIMSRNFSVFMLVIFCFGCETAFERSLVDQQPKLIAPGNFYVTSEGEQYFYWSPSQGVLSYELQVVTPKFDSIQRLVIDTLSGFNTLKLTLDTGKYQWRVRAFNYSSKSKYSDTFSIIIK